MSFMERVGPQGCAPALFLRGGETQFGCEINFTTRTNLNHIDDILEMVFIFCPHFLPLDFSLL